MSEEDRYEMSKGVTFTCEVCTEDFPTQEISQVRDCGHWIKVCSGCKPKILKNTEKTMRMDIAGAWETGLNSKMIRDLELCYVTMFEEQNEDRALGLKLIFKGKWNRWDNEWY